MKGKNILIRSIVPGSLLEHSAQMSDPLSGVSSSAFLLELPSKTSGPGCCSHNLTTSPRGSQGTGSLRISCKKKKLTLDVALIKDIG